MEETLFITSDTGRRRRTTVETSKIDDDSLENSRVTMPPAKYRLGFGETQEETIEMNIKGVTSIKATIEAILAATDKTVDQGSKDLMCPPKR